MGKAITRICLHRLFPQRQIYVRSAGQVQFFTFTPALQAMLAGIALIFLTWVTFVTTVVVFKDRSIAALDDRFSLTQAAYQSRLTNLQHARANLTSGFGQERRRFDQTSRDLTVKQGLLRHC